MTDAQKDELYHACRLAYVWGDEGKPWHLLLAALRQALCPHTLTYKLTDADLEKYPELNEILAKLKAVTR